MAIKFKRNKGPYREAIQLIAEHLSERELKNLVDRLYFSYKGRFDEISTTMNTTNPEEIEPHIHNGNIVVDMITTFSRNKLRKQHAVYELAMPHIFKGKVIRRTQGPPLMTSSEDIIEPAQPNPVISYRNLFQRRIRNLRHRNGLPSLEETPRVINRFANAQEAVERRPFPSVNIPPSAPDPRTRGARLQPYEGNQQFSATAIASTAQMIRDFELAVQQLHQG